MQVTSLLCFPWFPEGSDPRTARARENKTQFSSVDLASKTVLFSRHVGANPQYLWRRNPFKRYHKTSLKARCAKICVFCFLVQLLISWWTGSGVPLRASGTTWPSKGQGFTELEALDSQNVLSHLGWGPLALQAYRVFSNRAPRTGQKRQSSMLAPGSGPRDRKGGPSNFALNLNQQPGKRRSI